jgi:effector-binding domain-containing protein
MLETPQIIETEARPIAVLPLKIAKNEIQKLMGPGLAELKAAVAAQGILLAGPWFTHHLRMFDEGWDYEIGVPVERPVAALGRIHGRLSPVFRAARTVYHGPYEGLGAAWGEFNAWIDVHHYKRAPDLWERYVVGFESGPDGTHYRTELTRPLTD